MIVYNYKFMKEFWKRVSKSQGCWLWVGVLDYEGYGRVNCPLFKKTLAAHRVSWEVANKRSIPEGKHILHACDTPACVNPLHLYVGDPAKNAADRKLRGRGACGERMNMSSLTEGDARTIRELYKQGGHTHRALAAAFGVSHNTIGHIIRAQTWRHVG